MQLTDIFIRRPVLAIVVSLDIVLAGGAALVALPIRQYPSLESATIVVDTSFPGATQEVMQGFVTTPMRKPFPRPAASSICSRTRCRDAAR